MRILHTVLATTGVVLLALPLASPALADPAPPLVGNFTAKLIIPIDTLAADPNTLENVHITGSVLVKTIIRYFPPNPIKILTSFKPGREASGVGMTSGDLYTIKGNGTQKYDWLPGASIKAVDHTGLLIAVPGNPVMPTNPVRVHLHVDYDPFTGAALGSTVDFPATPLADTCTTTAQVCY